MNNPELEDQRLASEIARNEAERDKLLREADEVNRRLEQRWYSGRVFLQAVVAGVVAAGLLTAWGIGYLKPILARNTELNRLDVEISKRNTELQMRVHSETEKRIQAQLEDLSKQNELLLVEQERLKNSAQARIDEIDRDAVDDQASAEAVAALKAQNQMLEDAAKSTQARSESISEELDASRSRLSSGTVIVPCGCNGYVMFGAARANPSCASGIDTAVACPGECPLGGFPWAAVCQ